MRSVLVLVLALTACAAGEAPATHDPPPAVDAGNDGPAPLCCGTLPASACRDDRTADAGQKAGPGTWTIPESASDPQLGVNPCSFALPDTVCLVVDADGGTTVTKIEPCP